jgi:hypothetical protein
MGKFNTFKMFLASSGTLAEERKEIALFISTENKRLVKQGVFIELVVWEDLLRSLYRPYWTSVLFCILFLYRYYVPTGQGENIQSVDSQNDGLYKHGIESEDFAWRIVGQR